MPAFVYSHMLKLANRHDEITLLTYFPLMTSQLNYWLIGFALNFVPFSHPSLTETSARPGPTRPLTSQVHLALTDLGPAGPWMDRDT
jgi:hypothetical protein